MRQFVDKGDGMEEEEFEIKEEVIAPEEELMWLAQKNKLVMLGNPTCPGCGSILALKIALQVIDNHVLVLAPGEVSPMIKYPVSYIKAPVVHSGCPAAAASPISKAFKVLVYAGDVTTASTMESVMRAARKNENMLYICYNNSGSASMGFSSEKRLARNIPGAYVATAAVSNIEDYVKKLKKASQIRGFRFIEVLTPCPQLWKFDTSNTIEISRIAVETAYWLLYEIIDDKLEITSRPQKIEPVEIFIQLQKRFFSPSVIENLKETINKNIKLLQKK